MHITDQSAAGPFVLACGSSATLAAAAEHRARLIAALDRNDGIFVDLGPVDEMDVTFIQLLVSARKSAQRAGKAISIGSSRSDAILRQLGRANVAEIDLPPVAPAPITSAAIAPAAAAPIEPEAEIDAADAANQDIDHDALAKLANEIGEAALQQSLGVFFVQMASRLEVLRGLSPPQGLPQIKRETHLLKGTAGTFGLSGLRSEVIAFERDAAAMDAQAYTAALDRMSDTLHRAQAAIEAASAPQYHP